MWIKEKLKKSEFFMGIYNKLLPFYCIYFTKPAVKMLYKQTFQVPLNLKNPKDLNEKINWLKVYRYKNDPLVALCADKYRVRKYIQECGCEEILNTLYGVYYDYKTIDFDSLPDQFVLKLNRGAGMNLICKDKSSLNIKYVRELIKKWFKSECGERFGELHYRNSKPCVICEKYLGDEDGNYPVDYKVHTFGGKVHAVEICTERNKHVKFMYVDTSYHRLKYEKEEYDDNSLPPKPKCFSKMIEYAEQLGKPFSYVRVDFYIFKEQVVFGEMTFTHNGGFDTYIKQEALDIMGNLLILPNKKKE